MFAAGEAAALATRGLAACKNLPDGEQRLKLNLELEFTLAFALRVSKGNSAPETGGSMLRARELSERAGVTDYAPALLWGLWLYYQVGGDLATARHFGEQLLSLGDTGDAEVLLGAHTALGITSVHVGELVTGHDHLERAVTFHDPAQHSAYVARYNLDPGVYAGTQNATDLVATGLRRQGAGENVANTGMVSAILRPSERRLLTCLCRIFLSVLSRAGRSGAGCRYLYKLVR